MKQPKNVSFISSLEQLNPSNFKKRKRKKTSCKPCNYVEQMTHVNYKFKLMKGKIKEFILKKNDN